MIKKTATKQTGEGRPASKAVSTAQPRGETISALAAVVKRLEKDVEEIKAQLKMRPAVSKDTSVGRQEQDKLIADRLARLSERVDALAGHVSDLEDRLEGEEGHAARDYDSADELEADDR